MLDESSSLRGFEPVSSERMTFLVEDCIGYSSQLLEWAKTPIEGTCDAESHFDPVIAFVGLSRAYREAAMSEGFLSDTFSQASPPGATVEKFAEMTASSYHKAALQIAEMIFKAIAKTLDIRFVNSQRLDKHGGWTFQLFFPDSEVFPVDHAVCKQALAELPGFDAPRLLAFVAKEAISAQSRATHGKTGGEGTGHNDEIHLSRNKMFILKGMLELTAVDSDSRVSADDIAAKVAGPPADSNNVKAPLAELKKDGLVESKEGRTGGSWLTAAGRKRAEKLK